MKKSKRKKKLPGNLSISNAITRYCQMSRQEIMKEMDFITHDHNGGYLGFKKSPKAKILAIAHIDHLGSGTVHEASKARVVSSALDDRAGVYTALHLLPAWGINADVLLTDNEESGLSSIRGIGYEMLSRYNWIVELDRSGTGIVSYGFAPDINDHLKGYFDINIGSYSDISELEDISPVAAFNMGVGYHLEHSERCYLVISELREQLDRLYGFYCDYAGTPIRRDHVEGEVYGLTFEMDYLEEDWGPEEEVSDWDDWYESRPPRIHERPQEWDWAGSQ